jgi:peptidoglycan/LPS O-acetylase OafA/YrhL
MRDAKNRTTALLSRLARSSTSGQFIPEIDGLRTVAVLAVILFHLHSEMKIEATADRLSQLVASVIKRGFFGVSLFFALSAFIVGMPFARHYLQGQPSVATGRFFLRRLTRLEPPYLFNLLCLWLFGFLVGTASFPDRLTNLLAGICYQHNQVFGAYNLINPAAWSLEVEFQFYLLAPILMMVFMIRRPWLRRTFIVGASLIIIFLRDPSNRRVELSLLGQFEAFSVGLLLLDIYLTEFGGKPRRRFGWDVLGIVGWLAIPLAMRMNQFPPWRDILVAILLLVALIGSLGGSGFSAVLGNRWVFTFGGMCYTFYLWHTPLLSELIPVANFFSRHVDSYWAQLLVQSLFCLPIVTLVCGAIFVFVEKPFMRRDWPARLVARLGGKKS